MPICIECSHPVPQLYHILQGPTTKSTTKSSTTTPNNPKPPSSIDVRLIQCPRCAKFADKYVEHDFIILFIDLILLKPQVYRHLLINRLDVFRLSVSHRSTQTTQFNPAILRLGLLLTLFDVYLTWSRIEGLPPEKTARSPVPSWPVAVQYLFFVGLSLAAVLAQHAVVRTLVGSGGYFARLRSWFSVGSAAAPPTAPPPTAAAANSGVAISTALIVSSCMKLFPILMVVWAYDDASGQLARGVKVVVAVQNLEALRVVLGVAYWRAGLLVLAGRVVEDVVAQAVLEFGGLGETSVGWGVDVGRWF